MEPHTPVHSNPATAFAWATSSPVSSVNGSFAGTPRPTFHYGHQQSQGFVQQPQSSFVTSASPPMFATQQIGQQQFGDQQGIKNQLANHQLRSLNQQTLQLSYHNQNRISQDDDAERQQRLRELYEMVNNPESIINELVLHNGDEKAYKIQARLTELLPAADNQIQKNELSIKHAERALTTLKERNSLLKKQASNFRSSSGLPFLQSLNGQDSNVIVSFPFVQVPRRLRFWIKARINTVTAGKNLNKCPPAILQKVFGLTTYSALDNLTRDQLVLILVALHDQDYSDQQCFKDLAPSIK